MDFNFVAELIVPLILILNSLLGYYVHKTCSQINSCDAEIKATENEIERKFDQMNREAEYEGLSEDLDQPAIIDIPNLAEDQ